MERKSVGAIVLYMSLAVNGPESENRMLSGADESSREMLKRELFQTWTSFVAMQSKPRWRRRFDDTWTTRGGRCGCYTGRARISMVELLPSILSADFCAARRAGCSGRARRRHHDPCGHHGWAFRSQYHHRSAGGEELAQGHQPAPRLPPDDRESRRIYPGVCRGGGELGQRALRDLPAPAPLAGPHRRARHEAWGGAQSGHAGRSDHRHPADGPPRAHHERESRFRGTGIYSLLS